MDCCKGLLCKLLASFLYFYILFWPTPRHRWRQRQAPSYFTFLTTFPAFFLSLCSKMVVKVANLDPQETPPFKVSRRGNADLSTALVQVNVPGDVVARDNVMVRIDLQEVGFMSGNDIVGSLEVPLGALMEKGCIAGIKKLKQPGDFDNTRGRSGASGGGRYGGGERDNGGANRGGRFYNDDDEDNRESLDNKKGSWAKVEIRWIGNFS
jgi:hypothetical protein